MSNYNTQLQSNNTDLQTVLQTLQTKAAGGSGEQEDIFITKAISGNYFNDRVTTVGGGVFAGCKGLTAVNFPACTTIDCASTPGNQPSIGAFQYCSNLTTVSFPVCTSIGSNAFYGCYRLTTVSFPVCTTIEEGAFNGCDKLTAVSFPVCTSIKWSAFQHCSNLTTVSFPVGTSIGGAAFQHCYNLKSLYLTGSNLCTLAHSNTFTSTPIGGYSASAGTYGSIYVPASLLTSYQTATNWTYFSSRFVTYIAGGHTGGDDN